MPETRAQGFSLLEVNIALAVLALGLGSMMATYLSVGYRVQYGYQQQQAQLVIEQMVAVLPVYAEQLAWLQAQSNQLQTAGNSNCWRGQVCDKRQMLLAWWAYWQAYLAQHLPDGQCLLACQGLCLSGGSLQLQVRWHGGSYISAACDGWHCLTLDWPL